MTTLITNTQARRQASDASGVGRKEVIRDNSLRKVTKGSTKDKRISIEKSSKDKMTLDVWKEDIIFTESSGGACAPFTFDQKSGREE
jgi:hypothetical protein